MGKIVAGERIAILGMARSGRAAASLALREGARVTALDLAPPTDAREALDDLAARGVEFTWGPHPLELLDRCDRIVKSPGVPGEIPFLSAARSKGIPIWSEIEIASRCARGTILAITGTNGKSTTTAWTADMLQRCGRSAEAVGNIGLPLAEAVLRAGAETFLVTEVSSFQLEDIESFRPAGAALLNLTPDHLDRHPDLASYREAKMQLFRNQSAEDHAVIGEQDDLAEEVARRFRPRLLRFRLEDRGGEGAHLRRGRLSVRWEGIEEPLCAETDLALPGAHNAANALAALALLAPYRLPIEGRVESLRRFPGLPHRLEKVAEVDGVAYVNDSKATNTDSLATALEAFASPLLLLVGGRGKGQDFSTLAGAVRRRCRLVFVYGESAAEIRAAWGEDLCSLSSDLEGALLSARRQARRGEVVLLSPACASFDQFRDYEDRGDRFRAMVRKLARRDREDA